jgi:hypothetical protein
VERARGRRPADGTSDGVRVASLVARSSRERDRDPERPCAGTRRAYGSEGVSLRQHDGVAAGQEIDHLHVHVFPRHAGDRLYERNSEHRFAAPEKRAVYAKRLQAALETRQLGS